MWKSWVTNKLNIEPKRKNQAFTLMVISIIIAFWIHASFTNKRMKIDLCLETNSVSLNEVK